MEATTLTPAFKRKLILATTLMILAALAFNAFLTSATLEKLYIKSLASTYGIIGRDLQISLEKSVRYGKKIDKFVGMERLLQNTHHQMTKEKDARAFAKIHVSIALANGIVRYSTSPDLVAGSTILTPPDNKSFPVHGKEELFVRKQGKTHLIFLPIQERSRQTAGFVVIGFDQEEVDGLMESVHREYVKIGGVILFAGFILLVIAYNTIPLTPRNRSGASISKAVDNESLPIATPWWKFFINRQKKGSKGSGSRFGRRLMTATLAIIILCQIAFSIYGRNAFYSYYLEINREKVVLLNHALKDKIEFLLGKGLEIDGLFKVEDLLYAMIEQSPEIEKIELQNKDGMVLHRVVNLTGNESSGIDNNKDKNGDRIDPAGFYSVKTPLVRGGEVQGDEIQGRLVTTISKDKTLEQIKAIGLDALTVLVIAILFSFELLIIIFQMVGKTVKNRTTHYMDMRPAAFIFAFGIDICVSFLPLYMDRLYIPNQWIPRGIFIALPISIEMLFEGVAILLAGSWLDRRGWHEPFLWGVVLTGSGLIYSWLAPDAFHLIASRGVSGLGYGFVIMAAQGFAISYSNADQKSHSLTQLYAGLYAGSICGGAAGAMLAERLGFQPIFLIGGLLILSILGYVFFFMGDAVKKSGEHKTENRPAPVPLKEMFKFCLNRNVLGLITLIAIPASVSLIGFLYYCIPIYLNDHHVSQSNIGRVFMLHGICLVYVAPLISRFVDRSTNKRSFLMLSSILTGVGFLAYYLFQGFMVTLFSVVALGVAGGLMYAAQNPYLLKLPISQALGEGKSLSIISATSRIGQILGPFIFGWMFIVGIDRALPLMGALYLVAALAFFLFTQKETVGGSI